MTPADVDIARRAMWAGLKAPFNPIDGCHGEQRRANAGGLFECVVAFAVGEWLPVLADDATRGVFLGLVRARWGADAHTVPKRTTDGGRGPVDLWLVTSWDLDGDLDLLGRNGGMPHGPTEIEALLMAAESQRSPE